MDSDNHECESKVLISEKKEWKVYREKVRRRDYVSRDFKGQEFSRNQFFLRFFLRVPTLEIECINYDRYNIYTYIHTRAHSCAFARYLCQLFSIFVSI